MWLRFLEAGARFGKIKTPLGLYYINPTGMSTNPATSKRKSEEENKIRNLFIEKNLK